MDNIHKKSLKLLNKYFKENSKEFIEKEIDKISKLNIEGVSFDKYMQSFSSNYEIDVSNFKTNLFEGWETTFESNLSKKIERQEITDASIIYNYEKKENSSYSNNPEFNLAA